MRKRRLTAAAVAATLVASLAVAAVALGAPSSRQVEVLDDCDAASFNAVLGDGACVKDGGVTFEEFIGQLLAQGRAPAWRFAPGHLKLAAGETITARNRGGEFHTFTEVAAFGGGCVEELNALLGLTPVPECGIPGIFGTTGVAPGGTVSTGPLAAGTHRFLCLIHPWMRTTATAG
ncbi:MAG: cupredoxin domain-containing protein [Gaiellaceae bacterium]